MKKIFVAIIFLFMATIRVEAYSAAVVMDADSGRVLYSENENTQYLIASTTKIMTALVALNYGNLDEEVTAGEEILSMYGSSIYLKPGEKMTLRDLLYGLMLRSGNDASVVIAKSIAGSVDGFVKLMNDTAIGIGMHDTVFMNPHGLDEETQNKSTVYDMALLMVEAMKNKEFRKITSTKKYLVESNFGKYEWYNKNKLLTDYKYATGGKIGYTGKARHTFVSSASKNGKNLVIATFVDPDRFKTHEALYEKYFDLYKKYRIVDKDNLAIDYKSGGKIHTRENFDMLLTKEEKSKVTRNVEIYENVLPSSGEQVVGTLSILLDGKTIKKMNIYSSVEKIIKKTFWDKVKEFFKW